MLSDFNCNVPNVFILDREYANSIIKMMADNEELENKNLNNFNKKNDKVDHYDVDDIEQSNVKESENSGSDLIGKERGNWSSKTEYILSCLGYAIGIGNVWRFPYLCYRNGGGAFLIPYLSMLLSCGIPLYFMETCWGQFASTGCITMFKLTPIFKGAGYAIVIVNFICTIYYNVIISYPLLFLVKSIRFELPWENCNNSWNTDRCVKLDGSNSTIDKYMNNSFLDPSLRTRTPADEFFHNEILEISPGIDEPNGIVWPLFTCNLISWIILFLCIKNGVKSVGKVVYFTATFPFVILGILLIRGITLPGAIDGIKFYITPQWGELKNLKVWADAAVQIFFSLGPGWGGIVNMASYNKFKNNTKWDSIMIPVLNCSTSIFAGFVVFSVLGYMSHRTGIPVPLVATGGPGLAFVTYPEAIAMLPFPQIWAVLFFVMLYLLGMDSCFVQIEAIISSVLDEYPQFRPKKQAVAFWSCFIMFLGSISCVTRGGMYLVQLLDWYSASISVIFICTIEILIIGWFYGINNFIRDVEFMISDSVGKIWIVFWKCITPTILISIFFTTILFNTDITYNGLKYPQWAIYIGWGSCLSSIIWIPIYMIYKLLTEHGSLRNRIKNSFKPYDWGPSMPDDREAWLEMMKNTPKK